MRNLCREMSEEDYFISNTKNAGVKYITPVFLLLGQGPVEQSSTNKPLAMRVVEDALAYSKKPPVI